MLSVALAQSFNATRMECSSRNIPRSSGNTRRVCGPHLQTRPPLFSFTTLHSRISASLRIHISDSGIRTRSCSIIVVSQERLAADLSMHVSLQCQSVFACSYVVVGLAPDPIAHPSPHYPTTNTPLLGPRCGCPILASVFL